jgi:hypothetical protein
MRIRNIFVASLLTMTFGCPGDDSGDTDAVTTVATTTGNDQTTTDNGTTTTGDTPGSTSTGDTPAESSSGEPAESSSGAPGDSSSGGGETTTGGVNEACATFCTNYFTTCGEGDANDYVDEAGCVAACDGYDEKMFDCKEFHLSMADGPDSVHCGHANIDGGGVC